MATMREFVTRWVFQADHDKLDKVESQLEGIKHRLDFLAAAEVSRAIFEVAEKFAKLAEDIHLSAQAAGIGVEAFQKLAASAGESGVSQDEMGNAMTRLSRKMYDAKNGSEEAQKAFGRIGITPQQVAGFKNGQEALLAISDKMKGIKSATDRSAVSVELFGRGSVRMGAWLGQGSQKIKETGDEFESLGAIMGEGQIHALVELEHAFQKIWGVIRGIAGVIASVFAPEIKYLIDSLLGWVKANRELIAVDLKEWIHQFLYALGFVWGVIEGIIQIIYKWAESHKTLSRLIMTALAIGAAIVAIGVAALVLGPIFSSVAGLISGAFALIFSPLGAFVAILGLAIVLIHDLWAAAHGRPTWISQFLDWIGVGQMVNDIFQSIFQVIDDIMHLRLGDFFRDSAKALEAILTPFAEIGKFIEGAQSGIGGAVTGGLKSLFGFGGSGETPNAANLGIPSSESPNISSTNSASNQYSVNAPINVTVPPGTDAKDIGKHVQNGVKDHLDRVYRETQRSLQPAVKY